MTGSVYCKLIVLSSLSLQDAQILIIISFAT